MPHQPNNSSASYNVLLGGTPAPSNNYTTPSSSPRYAQSIQAPSVQSGTSQTSQSSSGGQYFLTLCKTFRLHILYSIWGKITDRTIKEEPKIAFHKGRGLALVRGFIHWIPLAAAATLISLNISHYYIGGELAGTSGQDTSKLAALQFAAKLHELLMLASIGTATFAYIREKMAFGDGVTIGTVFAGQQFSSINNLWSMEFWSAVYDAHKHRKDRRLAKIGWYEVSSKWRMVWLITLATILGVSVGPSGAVLMRPRLEWWPAGGTDFWLNVTSESLYPETIHRDATPESCSNFTGDIACPYGGFESFIEQYATLLPHWKDLGTLPESIWLPGERSLRETKIFMRSSRVTNSAMWNHDVTWVYGPTVGVSNAISSLTRLWSYAAANAKRRRRFRFRKDASFSVEVHLPYVQTYCTPFIVTSLDADTFKLRFADTSSGPMESIYNDELAEFGFLSTYPRTEEFTPEPELFSWLAISLLNDTKSSVRWLDNAKWLDATNSSLLAVVALPNSVVKKPTYLTCNMRTLWIPALSRGTRENPSAIGFTGRNGEPAPLDTDKDSPWKPYITLRPSSEWAEYTNPYLPRYDMDVFALTTDAAGLSDTALETPLANVPYSVESILSLMIMNGLSRLPYRAEMLDTLKDTDYMEEFLPKNGLGFGGQAFNITAEVRSQATQFKMEARVNGYAYSPKGATQIAAIAVLLVYCLLAFAHIVVSTSKGLSSGAWDTTPELTALAYNSEKSDVMENTGAGIHAIRTMEQNAVIRARGAGLQLMIGDGKGGPPNINKDELYG